MITSSQKNSFRIYYDEYVYDYIYNGCLYNFTSVRFYIDSHFNFYNLLLRMVYEISLIILWVSLAIIY
jgi:hypothetical protein